MKNKRVFLSYTKTTDKEIYRTYTIHVDYSETPYDNKLNIDKDNTIPPLTHRYGTHWQQPPTYLILIDDTHAVMSRLDFEILMDYTRYRPSTLYNGKMWKAQYENEGVLKWFLCYCFNENVMTNDIDIAYREILIID